MRIVTICTAAAFIVGAAMASSAGWLHTRKSSRELDRDTVLRQVLGRSVGEVRIVIPRFLDPRSITARSLGSEYERLQKAHILTCSDLSPSSRECKPGVNARGAVLEGEALAFPVGDMVISDLASIVELGGDEAVVQLTTVLKRSDHYKAHVDSLKVIALLAMSPHSPNPALALLTGRRSAVPPVAYAHFKISDEKWRLASLQI